MVTNTPGHLARVEALLRELDPQVTLVNGKKVVKPAWLQPGTDGKLQTKSDNINIPRVSSEEATLSAVITYLIQRSKDVDPDKEGVNIFVVR